MMKMLSMRTGKGSKKSVSMVIFVAVLLLVQPLTTLANNPLSIAEFERSAFFQKYPPLEKDTWSLRSGGTNYYYRFKDSENAYSSISVELGSHGENIKRLSVSWNGESTYSPATLTKTKEQFLRVLLRCTYLDIAAEEVISYIRRQQSKNYPGGSSAMPRKRLKTARIFAGTVGESLIVGIER